MLDHKEISALIPLMPFIGAMLWGLSALSRQGLFGKATKKVISFAAPGVVLLSFFIGLYYLLLLVNMPANQRLISEKIFPWISTAQFTNYIGFALDPLSVVMILVVSGVAFLIHVYSIGYMQHDPCFAKFFAYLNLFTGMMLVLVMADNILLMFVGWEGVGLCSYLLIGFWYDDIAKARAGMKAFIVNRIGDFAFIVGMFSLFWMIGDTIGMYSLDFAFLNGNAGAIREMQILGFPALEFVAIMLFIGATGKSAQIPLYVWLPDAMAGPTPVSALIHAATMVTAGVFMIGRLGWVFMEAPFAMATVAIIGALTSFMAATIAITQFDIKKVLAYSTVSQLGYMFLAMGVGAFSAGIFHLMTHAFFKALLFLGSGSVIMGMHHDQDMRNMGGLLKKMKITGVTFLIGVLAIAGIFPFAGFFSKDEILFNTFLAGTGNHGETLYYFLYTLGMVTAFLTAMYMFRQLFMTFFGSFRGTPKPEHNSDDHGHHHGAHKIEQVHESPLVVTVPLIILAVLSAIAGFLNMPHAMGGGAWFHHWLEPIWPATAPHGDVHALELGLALLSLTIAIISAFLAFLIFHKKQAIAKFFADSMAGLHTLLFNKYFVDELYDMIIIRPVVWISRLVAIFDRVIVDGIVNGVGFLTRVVSTINGWIDNHIVDGAVNGLSDLAQWGGSRVSKLQTGYLFTYVGYAVAGIIVVSILFIMQ